MTLIALLAVAQMVSPAPVEAQTFSYAVKFVCGFNRTNLGTLTDGSGAQGGENVVKLGNYATDVNIFNPGNDTEITKKALLLVKEGQPVGREPTWDRRVHLVEAPEETGWLDSVFIEREYIRPQI